MSDIYTNPAGNLVLEVKDDKLSAWLTIRKTGKLIDEKDILDLMDSAGIKAGFDEAYRYIREHDLEKDYDVAFPIAVCEYEPHESPLNLHFDDQKARKADPDVTPESIRNLEYVEAGTVIADYSDNIFDRRGSIFNVFGEMIHVESADESSKQALAGDKVCFDPRLGQYTASRSGYVRMDDTGCMSIIDTLVIRSDVKDAGEIFSPVDLIVEGSVSNCRIVTRGNLVIRGQINGCTLFCEGNLVAEGNISACQVPGIQVLGDLQCGGVTTSYVLCRGKIEFSGIIGDSFVVGEKGVESTDRGSRLLGGTLQSSGSVLLDNVGEPSGPEALIEVTISPFYKALLMQLTKDMVRAKQSEDKDEITQVREQTSLCEAELDRQLNDFLKRVPNDRCRILVRGELYPVLNLRVLKHDYTIKTRQTGLDIYEKD
jgi:uncharacterized protein (DUF342 family)